MTTIHTTNAPINIEKELEQLRMENSKLKKRLVEIKNTYTPFVFDKTEIGMMLYDHLYENGINGEPTKEEQKVIDEVFDRLQWDAETFDDVGMWDRVKEVVEDIKEMMDEESENETEQ
jgi:hypothetical protein